MGHDLGGHYFQLMIEVLLLNGEWSDFKNLFCTSAENVDLINSTAGDLFSSIQHIMADSVLMHISRICENKKSTLNLVRVIRLIPKTHGEFRDAMIDEWNELKNETRKIKNHRDERLAHLALPLASGLTAANIPNVELRSIQSSIDRINSMMNKLSLHFGGTEMGYAQFVHQPLGTDSLLYYLRLGLESHRSKQPWRKVGYGEQPSHE